ncbi:hypothetical protein QE152_g19364 [Popillia japonica]|uniref:Uncharacterized protein n=1 Tax=Popillia japonica TaxID=7064 RepID=A0AAW1KS15_POPJA
MPPRDEEDRSWMVRVGQFLCSNLGGDSSSSSVTNGSSTDGRKPRGSPRGSRRRCPSVERGVEACPSTTVTIGSSVPSGTNLYERESDIEYFYPDPAFVVDGPPSEIETVIVHKSISETLNE